MILKWFYVTNHKFLKEKNLKTNTYPHNKNVKSEFKWWGT